MRAARLALAMPVSTQKTLTRTAARPIEKKNMNTFGDCTNASWKSRGSSRMIVGARSGAPSWDATADAGQSIAARLSINFQNPAEREALSPLHRGAQRHGAPFGAVSGRRMPCFCRYQPALTLMLGPNMVN